ncbi:hypothetical protein [Methylobacterium sp. J-067]|uniref:hypothetical protein n=1 Tax=Methylobacterium sp. J-067 TaxID=2836648 RepID=UPI001FBB8443|nr:hypothetical protein [Methylobacterium sp. J-067]MCJ2023135.1 hypothetical protein [Methylobacterium sp. J-067]
MNETPDLDLRARAIAENVYAAYCRQATMPIPYREEQTVLARLVEALRPQIGSGTPGELIEAANIALSDWEQRDAKVRGPRVASINQIDGVVTVG